MEQKNEADENEIEAKWRRKAHSFWNLWFWKSNIYLFTLLSYNNTEAFGVPML